MGPKLMAAGNLEKGGTAGDKRFWAGKDDGTFCVGYSMASQCPRSWPSLTLEPPLLLNDRQLPCGLVEATLLASAALDLECGLWTWR